MPFILALVSLIVLSGSSLYYFRFVALTSTVSPTQTIAAPATAAAQAYATGTARQGIMFGFNAQHIRNNPHEHILNADNVSYLHQKWTVAMGDKVGSSPAVANGTVYIGSHDRRLYAFDASSGQQKWVASTGGSIGSSPAVANGVVYIGSYDYKLYAFDASTGKPKWVSPPTGNSSNPHRQ